MARFYVLSFLLLVALTAIAMISCLSAQAGTVRGLPRGLWVVLILFVPLIGPVLYFAFGRPQRGGGSHAGLPPAPSRPIAPDDDPDFLYRLGRGRPAPGPNPPVPTEGNRAGDDARAKDDGRSNDNPKIDDSRNTDAKDDGRSRDDARTKDDQPPSDGGG